MAVLQALDAEEVDDALGRVSDVVKGTARARFYQCAWLLREECRLGQWLVS